VVSILRGKQLHSLAFPFYPDASSRPAPWQDVAVVGQRDTAPVFSNLLTKDIVKQCDTCIEVSVVGTHLSLNIAKPEYDISRDDIIV